MSSTEVAPATEHEAREITDRAEDAITTVRREKDLGLYEGDEDAYLTRLTALVERRNTLRTTPSKPARYERVPVGRTWNEAIDAAEDATALRAILLKTGLRLTAKSRGRDVEGYFDLAILERTFEVMPPEPVE